MDDPWTYSNEQGTQITVLDGGSGASVLIADGKEQLVVNLGREASYALARAVVTAANDFSTQWYAIHVDFGADEKGILLGSSVLGPYEDEDEANIIMEEVLKTHDYARAELHHMIRPGHEASLTKRVARDEWGGDEPVEL